MTHLHANTASDTEAATEILQSLSLPEAKRFTRMAQLLEASAVKKRTEERRQLLQDFHDAACMTEVSCSIFLSVFSEGHGLSFFYCLLSKVLENLVVPARPCCHPLIPTPFRVFWLVWRVVLPTTRSTVSSRYPRS